VRQTTFDRATAKGHHAPIKSQSVFNCMDDVVVVDVVVDETPMTQVTTLSACVTPTDVVSPSK